MKKIILPALFLGAIAFGSTSCKKDYTCECTFSGSASGSISETQKMSKKDAKAWCEESSSSANGITVTCALK